MKLYWAHIMQTVAGTAMICVGLAYIFNTLNSRGLSSMAALSHLSLAIGIIFAGSMNIGLAYDRVGRSAIAVNTAGLMCFAAAIYLDGALFQYLGFFLFIVTTICSFFVASQNDRIRIYPYGGSYGSYYARSQPEPTRIKPETAPIQRVSDLTQKEIVPR